MPQAWDDLAALVSYKSVADPALFPRDECEKAASFVAQKFSDAGIPDVRLVDIADGSKAVYGHRPGPPAAPTVLFYSHYDVQPPLNEAAWLTPPWTLTARNGRWYGRGAADCKGNIVMQLTALRAAGADLPVGIKIVSEGTEEQSTGGMATFVRANAELLAADTIMVCDTGNAEVGLPTVTTDLRGVVHATVTVRTLTAAAHSGMFGGPAPDSMSALIHILSSLHDEHGDTTILGLDNTGRWAGVDYSSAQFRRDAGVLPGVGLLGSGTVSDMLWARPVLTVTGIDYPSVAASTPAIQGEVRAKLNLRIPFGTDAVVAWEALEHHLVSAAPWGVQVEVTHLSRSQPFRSRIDGPAFMQFAESARRVYGKELTTAGQGGSIPTCYALQETFPDAEIMLVGVEEPRCRIHAPNESVDPAEIAAMALTQAHFLLAGAGRMPPASPGGAAGHTLDKDDRP
jgi:acetylornithine deacetylase/succinyl-diaminopimelate desuccinylase-like protein